MVTDAASALFASPNAAGLTAAPAKGVAVGFEALLAALFGSPSTNAATAAQSQTAPAPAKDDPAPDAALAALQSLAAMPGPVPTVTTTAAGSVDSQTPARPNAQTWATGDGKPTAGQIRAASVAADCSVPGQATLVEASALIVAATDSVPTDPVDAAATPPRPQTGQHPLPITAQALPDLPSLTEASEHALPAKTPAPADPPSLPEASQHAAPAKAPALPDLPSLPEPSKAAEAVASAPARAAAGSDVAATVVATVVASTFEPPTAKALAVLADTPAADKAAVATAPASLGATSRGKDKTSTPKADAKSEPKPGMRMAVGKPDAAPAAVKPVEETEEGPPSVAVADDEAGDASGAPPARDAKAADTANAAQAQTSQASAAASAAAPRANPETVTRLATQLASHAAAKSTQFDIALEPAGLGKVEVRVQIAPDGALTAALAFATPHAASELRARAGELQAALQQAGFDLADGALSFDVAGHGGQGASHSQAELLDAWQERTLRAFAALNETPAVGPSALPFRRAGAPGLDIRI